MDRLDSLNSSIFQITGQHRQDFSTVADELSSLINVSFQQINNQVKDVQAIVLDQLSPSCAALPPSSPSGYHWVRASNGSAVRVYCEMSLTCGNVTGGWTRVAELDMTNSSQQCPNGLRQRTDSNIIRSCVRDVDLPGCSALPSTPGCVERSGHTRSIPLMHLVSGWITIYLQLMWMVLVSLTEIPWNIFGHLQRLMTRPLPPSLIVPA